MGMNCYISKIKKATCKNNKELEDLIAFSESNIIYDYRKHYWLDNFFRNNCINSRNYDEVLLNKKDIELLIKEIKTALETDCSNFDKDDFFGKDINYELNAVLIDMKELIKEDFNYNTFYYESCC